MLHYNGTAFQVHAGTAKAGLDALAKHLAVELDPKEIRVVGICPGIIGDTTGFFRLVPDSRSESYIPRVGKTRDIGNVAVFLASGAANFITGATFVVDGGQSLTMPNFAFADQAFRVQYEAASFDHLRFNKSLVIGNTGHELSIKISRCWSTAGL